MLQAKKMLGGNKLSHKLKWNVLNAKIYDQS